MGSWLKMAIFAELRYWIVWVSSPNQFFGSKESDMWSIMGKVQKAKNSMIINLKIKQSELPNHAIIILVPALEKCVSYGPPLRSRQPVKFSTLSEQQKRWKYNE